MSKELTQFDSDPYSLFAINPPSTIEKFIPRLNKFFEFIDLNGIMQEKCSNFLKSENEQRPWALGSVIRFLHLFPVINPKMFFNPSRTGLPLLSLLVAC